MRNNVNIIEIRGIRGLILAGMAVVCLFVGFIVFPGWLWMHAWNFVSSYIQTMPQIGVVQGVLLWGILITCYFLFKKKQSLICFKAPRSLSEEELKTVFADIKKQAETDPILKAMMQAREAELKLKNQEAAEDVDSSVEIKK